MIYDKPRCLPGGDRYVLMEFGNEMNLELNFIAQGFSAALAEAGVTGVIESAPCFASLLVHYEPSKIGYADLVRELLKIFETLGTSDDLEIPSRLFYMPVLYFDPWCEACVDDYRARIADKESDPELIIRENGLKDRAELMRIHSGTEHWVAALGFWPGLPFLMALDTTKRLVAPKYNPPRTDTPQGAIGLGGAATSIYPVATPGGYQVFGRTPIPIWDSTQKNPVFQGDLCLFKPGDRIRFVPIQRNEYDELEAQVSAGQYDYNVVEYQNFVVADYNRWLTKRQEAKQ